MSNKFYRVKGKDYKPIKEKSELQQFGFDWQRFRLFSDSDEIGGKEWHGPCPRCPQGPDNDDRLSVSNGMCICRICNWRAILADIAKDGYKAMTEEEIASQNRRLEAEEKERLADRSRKTAMINKQKLWLQFHQNLLNEPARLDQLACDGIGLDLVQQFCIGYNHHFPFRDDGVERIAPAFTFPHFSLEKPEWCVNIRMRILADPMPENGKYRPIYKNLQQAFLFCDRPELDTCFYLEGEKKAIAVYGRGFATVGLWGVNNWNPNWVPWFKRRFKHHIVIFDNDNPAVIKAGQKLASYLDGCSISVGGKIDDALRDGKVSEQQLWAIIRSLKETW